MVAVQQWYKDDYLITTDRARMDIEAIHRYLPAQHGQPVEISRMDVAVRLYPVVCGV
ncbi:hypothetical protein [Pantoea sp. JZ29]|uniref:hypothetical protein n=1 Tax=Pantoea sp. JZ29 TaxID=2654192 RepID=UPI002B4819E6|nr:hypothetical protein [Pantoea sp. JZ29]